MENWNELLAKQAERIIEGLKKFPEVKAIAFYGSIGYEFADEYSDIDIVAFCTKKPSLKRSKKFYKDFRIKMKGAPFTTGFLWKKQEWTIWIEKIDDMEKNIEMFFKDHEKFVWQELERKLANELMLSRLVWDPEGIVRKWKKKVEKYPLWLKEANFKRLLYCANRIGKIFKGIKRKNTILILNSVNDIVENFIPVIYALNGKYYSSTEWFYKDVRKFKVVPRDCLKRIEKICDLKSPPEKKIILIQKMLKELEILCKKQIPNFSIYRNLKGELKE